MPCDRGPATDDPVYGAMGDGGCCWVFPPPYRPVKYATDTHALPGIIRRKAWASMYLSSLCATGMRGRFIES